MSRPAAAARQKPEPTIRRARFAEEDLVSTFGEAMLAEARRLLRAGAVNLAAAGPAIEATIEADGQHHRTALPPPQRGARVAEEDDGVIIVGAFDSGERLVVVGSG